MQMSKKKTEDYKDVINFFPAPIMNVREWEVFEIHVDRDYFPVMNILLEGPKTVRELTAAYNSWCEERGSPKPKSDKTIYRYLKTLGEHGLVVPAGKRVVFGKTATETLYARSADFIRYHDFSPEFWKSKISGRFTQGVAIGLERLFEGAQVNQERLRSFLIEFGNTIESYIQEFVTNSTKEELESVRAVEENYYIETALKYMGIFGIILKHPELVDKLNDCLR